MEDKNSTAEQIEQEIAVLRQARENAAKELAKARQELREVLTPRASRRGWCCRDCSTDSL
ncbi:MAG: hypothetical protein ABIF19_08470 [Planctomycetota bacterium]